MKHQELQMYCINALQASQNLSIHHGIFSRHLRQVFSTCLVCV